MSDHDRGAYAPNSDAPLAFETFDARARSSRRPFPMALIGSGVVLLLLVTALVMFYRSGSKVAEGLPRPVGGGITAIKTAPTGEQPSDPTAGLEVYSPQNVPSNTMAASAPAPQFTPAPEQPMARPAAPPPVVAQAPKAPALTTPSPKPVAKTGAVAATTAKPVTGGAAPSPATAAKTTSVKTTSVAEQKGASPSSTTTPVKAATAKPTVATTKPVSAPAKSASAASVAASEQAEDFAAGGATTPSVASGTVTTALRPTSAKPATSKTAPLPPTKLAKSTPTPVEDSADEEDAPAVAALPKGSLAAAKPTTATPATAKGGFVVQVGAFPSAADADKGFSTASSKAGAAMSGKSKHVETVQKDGKTLYRSTVKGFATRDAAAQFCVALRAKGGQCIVRGGAGA